MINGETFNVVFPNNVSNTKLLVNLNNKKLRPILICELSSPQKVRDITGVIYHAAV